MGVYCRGTPSPSADQPPCKPNLALAEQPAPSGLALRKTEGPQETECAPHTSTPGPIDRTWPCLTAVLRLTSSECGLLMGIWEVAAAEHPCIRRPATLKPDPALAEGTP